MGIVIALTGCNEGAPAPEAVQRAVAEGASGALNRAVAPRPPVATVAPAEAPAAPGSVERVPVARVEGAGPAARAVMSPDRDHASMDTARLGEQFGAVWTDPRGRSLHFARLDAQGRALGPSVRVHAAAEDEESIAAPSIAAAGDGYGVAWIDPENGRVRLARFDAQGRSRGAPTIVHEGLESPRTARLSWNGREFGVAAGLWQGVYFARVGRNGERVGNGVLLSEGSEVAALDAVRWDGQRYTVSWTERREGNTVPQQARVRANGQREG